jgi:hypothetical protein
MKLGHHAMLALRRFSFHQSMAFQIAESIQNAKLECAQKKLLPSTMRYSFITADGAQYAQNATEERAFVEQCRHESKAVEAFARLHELMADAIAESRSGATPLGQVLSQEIENENQGDNASGPGSGDGSDSEGSGGGSSIVPLRSVDGDEKSGG